MYSDRKGVQQKHLDKTIFHQQVDFIWKKSLTNHHCTHLWFVRYRSNPLGHDCSWLIINLAVRILFCIILITNQTIYPVKCNFVWTKMHNVHKIENCWMLFQALYAHVCVHDLHVLDCYRQYIVLPITVQYM